jgi:hypothetical protein
MKRLTINLLMLSLACHAHAQLIWNGDASNGTGIFKAIGTGNVESPSTLTTVNDVTHGLVWRYHKPSGSNRCENHGIKVNGSSFVFQNNTTYYLGWSTRLSNNTNNNASFQWKSYGNHIQNFPVVLKMINGRLSMLQRQPGPEESIIWSAPFAANTWYHIVIGLHLSDATRGGWVELYFNGVQQTFTNGTQRYACRTFDGGHVCPKWGIYGASGTDISNYVDDLKVGFTYNDVKLPSSAQNLAFNKPATASSNDGNLPSNAVDGSTATRWSASGFPQWLEVDLGAVYSINRTELVSYQDRAYQFTVESKTTSTGTYTQIVNRNANTTPGTDASPITDNFGPVNARYVRLTVSGASGYTGPWSSIEEFRVFGTAALQTNQAPAAVMQTAMAKAFDIRVLPNPVVNQRAVIRYTLPQDAQVYVAIYYINGQAEVIANSWQQAGAHTLYWNAANKPKGIYIAHVQIGDKKSSVRLVVE